MTGTVETAEGEELALFDAEPWRAAPPVPAVNDTSPDRRRTIRQANAVTLGVHPLALLFGPGVRLHPDASRSASRDDPRKLPYTCGTCRFRELVSANARTVVKCMFGAQNPTDTTRHTEPPRLTHSAASDVRAWWPACADYSPGDNTLSPDAARCLPEEP